MGFGQSKPEPGPEIVRIPGYTYEYDDEMDEEKKFVSWRVTYGKPDWFGQRDCIIHTIEDGPETAEEFIAWMRFPCPKETLEQPDEPDESDDPQPLHAH
jgi:hypothetical protein